MVDLANNLKTIHGRITAACQSSGRNPKDVRLLAVTKGHSAETIANLYQLGCRRFGESYWTEMAAKWPALLERFPDIQLSFIGVLQSNKIRRLVELVHEIQSVASAKHLRLLAKAIKETCPHKIPFPIYLCVNVGEESQKQGFTRDQVGSAVAAARAFPELQVKGLMAIPPALATPWLAQDLGRPELPQAYRDLAKANADNGFSELSVGMSGDLEPAIAAGSTEVRIGTALCGPRPLS